MSLSVYDASGAIECILDALSAAELVVHDYDPDDEAWLDYPTEVAGRLRAARREVRAALANARETERQRRRERPAEVQA